MTSPIARCLRHSLLAALATLTLGVHAADREPVPTENFSTQKWAGAYLAEKASDALYDGIRQKGLALLVQVGAYGNPVTHCVATVGLTHAAPGERHPRSPNTVFYGANSAGAPLSDDDPQGCQGLALRRAIDNLVASPDVKHLLSGSDATLEAGGTWPQKGPEPTNAYLSSSGLSEVGKQRVFDRISNAFRRAFDYRYFQLSMDFTDLVADNGDRVCFAQAGFSARAPEGRISHAPAVAVSFARLHRKVGQRELPDSDCFNPVVFAALEGLLDKSWDTELIAQFDRVAEKGRPVPNAAAIRKALAAARPAPAQSTGPSTVPSRNGSVSCSTQCVNGDCVRTFENGRKERFQAQRKFNPFNSQWEWDSSGC